MATIRGTPYFHAGSQAPSTETASAHGPQIITPNNRTRDLRNPDFTFP
jgi:hypothetical protein